MNNCIGLIELTSITSGFEAGDAMIKAAVRLLVVRLAMAMGVEAFCTMPGDVAAVQASVAAGRAVISKSGLLVNALMRLAWDLEVF